MFIIKIISELVYSQKNRLNTMKKIYFVLFLFNISMLFAQEDILEIEKIAESEMKSASRTMEFQANPNTANYDITYHKLEFTVDPAVYFITGKVTTTFKALSNMTTVTFDLTNELTVSSVKSGVTNLSFVQNSNNELVITLPSTVTTGNFATVEINYSGEPAAGEDAFSQSAHNGTPIIWTLSEPFGARDWWPCKQDLNDKIENIDVFITAPSQYVSVSNGVEMSAVTSGSNKTTHFKHQYPIPAYLVAIAVTNYQIFNQTAGTAPNTFPIVNYIYPESYASAVNSLAQTLPIMNFFESTFETYPFSNEKYGHAQCGFGGGMEHTTVSFMGNFSRGLIAHELAHQWFGDKITCGTWKDIWLNEGFATYLSAMVIEHLDGAAAFVNHKRSLTNNITSSPTGNVYLSDTQATNVNRIFSSRLSYNKGAMVLEMLRFKMGDAAFFQALKNYLADADLAFDYAVTTDLKEHLEVVYGQDLTEFFNDWVYNQGYPTYSITAQNWGSGQVRFVINQSQSDASVSFFEMPVPIRVFGANGEQQDFILENTTNGQVFIENVAFSVVDIEFDPNANLISRNSTTNLASEVFTTEKAIVLYPNPTKDIFYIQKPTSTEVQSVTIFNSLGQMVQESFSTEMNVSALPTGIYAVTIKTSEGIFHKKIIKE